MMKLQKLMGSLVLLTFFVTSSLHAQVDNKSEKGIAIFTPITGNVTQANATAGTNNQTKVGEGSATSLGYKSMNQADFDGMNLSAIQTLMKKVEKLEAENSTLKQQLQAEQNGTASLKADMEQIKKQLATLIKQE